MEAPPRTTPTSAAARAHLIARLDRLPPSRYLWKLVLLLALGGFFEIYELFQTAYISPGLIQAGLFKPASQPGLWGLSDQATFAAATFLGLFIGTIAFASAADRFGRRAIFSVSLVAYTGATVVMACQSSALMLDLWRFLAGIGVGVQMVTVDAYLSELVPRSIRGRAFALTTAVQFTAIPFVAFLGLELVPHSPLGIAGWRWIPLLCPVFALAIWLARRALPESPRWLVQRGRLAEAEAVTTAIEARVRAELGRELEPPVTAPPERLVRGFPDLWRPPFRSRMVMLIVFNFFQTVGFYGFGNWVPALLASQGLETVHSLQYSFVIALVYPLSPLLFLGFADRIERKWQIAAAAAAIALFGLVFSFQRAPAGIIAFGSLVTASNCLLSYAYHAYQPELFPTSVRSRAVGFCYSWSRLSTVFSSFMIGSLLRHFGVVGVFVFISLCMAIVIATIGLFGPRTGQRSLESISDERASGA
jgi:putative MFS transporter